MKDEPVYLGRPKLRRGRAHENSDGTIYQQQPETTKTKGGYFWKDVKMGLSVLIPLWGTMQNYGEFANRSNIVNSSDEVPEGFNKDYFSNQSVDTRTAPGILESIGLIGLYAGDYTLGAVLIGIPIVIRVHDYIKTTRLFRSGGYQDSRLTPFGRWRINRKERKKAKKKTVL